MNTNKITQSGTTEKSVQLLNNGMSPQGNSASTGKPEEPIIMHEAEIITPQPYGVFALCKIFEHFQIN